MSDRIDLALVAGTVLTPEAIAAGIPGGSGAPRSVVAVSDGRIAGVASEESARERGWLDAADRVVDLGDATITAGLVDAHIHPILGLRMARGLDLGGITDRDAARAAIAEHVAASDDDWVLGWGLDPAVFGGEEFGNALLDGVDGGRKVYLTLFDGHSALISRAAVEATGLTGDEVFHDAASVGVDAAGRPTGMLYELSAQNIVLEHIPTQTFDERVDHLLDLLRGMAATGIVAGQVLDTLEEDAFEVLEEAERRGELAVRLRVSPSLFTGFAPEDLERVVAAQSRRGRRWHVRGVKLMIDGTVDNGTAWLFEPDTRGQSTSSLWLDPEEYRAAVRFFHEHGIPTTTHAIGDRGVSFVAETLAALEPAQDGAPLQHRIEHIETLPDPVLEQIVASGAAASMQPTHCTHYTRADHTDNWSQRLGDERAGLAWRIRSLRDRGVPVALGSDWPIAPYDARGIVAAARLRRPAGRPEIEPNVPDEAISARAALEGYTVEYWRSVGEPGGVIVAGAVADLTVFAANPLTTAPDTFAETAVLMTVVEGVPVHEDVPVGAARR